ncbi:MAG: serine/threonine protein kinase [Actinomycetota bacterium]|nr:serine/threonine protein kinase [Actinomycetota bacterium]
MEGFAGFQVLGRVAQGSTGVVWQARQVELDRLVAIKELSPVLLQAPGFLDRFRAEAQTLALLDDPHVVRIFDYVEEPGRAYLVQEWVDGAPLEAVLAQHGRLTPEQGLGVLRGGLIGLAHAHNRGLVHRDISPANILLDRGGTSKLLDFGLAAQTDQGITPGAATSLGTPAFASPEAASGAPMTTRSDVYSAAAVLYLLLSGRLPYSGDVGQVLAAHASAPVPRLDEHGPELADLLARAMAKNPAQRPADAAAFLAELEDAATQRYGAGWLSRASVAGLVTTTLAGTAAVTAAGTGAAAAPAAQATQTIAYGAAATPTTLAGRTAATAGGTGRRILGMPLAAALVALVLIIAAAAATTAVVTNNSPLSSAGEGARTPGGQQSGTAGPGPGSTAQSEPDSGSILYFGTLTQITTGALVTSDETETQIGVSCSGTGECSLVGFTMGGHEVIPLIRDGPGTFSAVLDGPGLSCDGPPGPFPATVAISLDESTMTMTGHQDGQTLTCGTRNSIWFEQNVTFEGTYVSGDLPGL